jgi:transposase
VTLLASQYDLHITEGAIVNHLDACKARFGAEYTQILSEIRHAPVKHADETSWRIAGVNCWAWLFATPTAALYTIEENRGKEIPTRILGPTPTGLLVRDDFASYTALALPQQSCWSHLLRTSREHAEKDTASPEMGALHTELGSFFGALKDENEKPFVLKERIRVHQTFFTQITTLIAHTYVADDARAIQTRIRNQGKNLIEALLHEHAPLTNNHAERMIRPLVVTRKISGGSQSNKGAATHAVNMSIVQTLSLRGINLFEGMRDLIHAGNVRYVAGKG